jgi:hypothetical protein
MKVKQANRAPSQPGADGLPCPTPAIPGGMTRRTLRNILERRFEQKMAEVSVSLSRARGFTLTRS